MKYANKIRGLHFLSLKLLSGKTVLTCLYDVTVSGKSQNCQSKEKYRSLSQQPSIAKCSYSHFGFPILLRHGRPVSLQWG